MVHYTCDGCQRPLDPQEDLRYVIRMEVYAAMDPLGDELEDDRDHLQEIQEILERAEDVEDEQIGDDVYQQVRFDLCCDCRRKFIRNPLAFSSRKQLDFSNN